MTRRVLVVAAVASFFACGRITVEETINSFGPPYCDKVQSCFPTEFSNAFPGGQADCIAKMKASIPAENLKRFGACTASQLQTCIDDAKQLTCGMTLDSTQLPESCAKC